jgi:hypothetical protein
VHNSVTVTVVSTAPTTLGARTWTTSASSVNPAKRDVKMDHQPVVTVTAGPPSDLVFTQQPGNTLAGQAISPAVAVTVKDAYGNTVTASSPDVTLSYHSAPTGAQPPTGNTATPSNGVATFPGLTVPTQGVGFSFDATNGTINGSTPSSSFDVAGTVVQCPANQSCDSGNVSSTSSNGVQTTGDVVAQSGPNNDVLTTTSGGYPSLACTTFGDVLSFSVATRAKTITYTLVGPYTEATDDAHHLDVSDLTAVCYGSPNQFTVKGGGLATFNSADGEYEGVLPTCNSAATNQPCLVSATDIAGQTGGKDAVRFVVKAPPGDPRLTGH